MTYVGATPTTGDFKKLDSITTSSATTFNLRQGGVAVYPQSANHCIVSLNGVIQAPVDAFTIVNDTIVFASSLASSDVINFILVLGNVNDIGTVSDDTVSQAKIQSEAVNEAKIQISNAGTNGQFLSKQSGNTGGLTWATPSGTWVQTGRVNNSSVGATTINLEGCFSNTYDVYMMNLRDFRPSVDGSRMRMIILTGTNTLVTGSHYRIAHSIDYATGTGAGGVKTERHTGSDEFHFFDSVADGEAHGGGSATLFITVDKTNTSGNSFKFHGTCSFTDSSDQQNTGKLGGFYKESTNDENPTGLQFKSDNNITSIDVTMYGLVQS